MCSTISQNAFFNRGYFVYVSQSLIKVPKSIRQVKTNLSTLKEVCLRAAVAATTTAAATFLKAFELKNVELGKAN